jgi:hypothetical protein
VTTSAANQDPESGAFLIPGSGIGKKQGSGSGMHNPDHISEGLEIIILVKISNSLMRIRHEKKIRIRDKHPGSATLATTSLKLTDEGEK